MHRKIPKTRKEEIFIRKLRRARHRTAFIKIKKEKLNGGDKEKLERWKEFFGELLNSETGKPIKMLSPKKKFTEIKKTMKNHKSPVQHCITAEIIKFGWKKLPN